MAKRFCVSITHCKSDPDAATVGFVVANAAIGSDKDTLVFLSADGVWAGVKDEMEKVDVGAPFAPLRDLVTKFQAAGGKIFACAPCLKKRGIEEAQLIDGAKPAGGASLVEFLSDGASCITY